MYIQKITGSLLLLVVLSGCQAPIKVTPLEFHHADEVRQEGEFMVLADRRVFAVMVFLNVCGYDHEAYHRGMHPVRTKVREETLARAEQYPEAWARWKRYYQQHDFPRTHYLNVALSMSGDYPFKRIRPFWELWNPTEAISLGELPDVLNEVWATLGLAAVWEEVKPDYLAEVNKYDFERMQHQVDALWGYLRMERRDDFTLVSVPNLLDSYYMAMASQFENYCYSVESPGSHSYALNVHEYLHSMINPMVLMNLGCYRSKLKRYHEAGKGRPMAGSYQRFSTYVCECMVRALDQRIRIKLDGDSSVTELDCESRVAQLTKDGLVLVQPFYDLLDDYEVSEMDFEEFLPDLLERLPEFGSSL